MAIYYTDRQRDNCPRVLSLFMKFGFISHSKFNFHVVNMLII